jgi:hypothetical protein
MLSAVVDHVDLAVLGSRRPERLEGFQHHSVALIDLVPEPSVWSPPRLAVERAALDHL